VGTSIVSSPAVGICARNRPKHLKASWIYFSWKNHVSKHRSLSALVISIEPGSLFLSEEFQICSPNIWGGYFAHREQTNPPNGSWGTGVADQCRHLLVCFTMCPRLAPAVSFAWFYNLIVFLYLFLQFLRRHGGTALFKSMAEQLCRMQNLGPPLKKRPKNDLNGRGHIMVQINPPFQTHFWSYSKDVG